MTERIAPPPVIAIQVPYTYIKPHLRITSKGWMLYWKHSGIGYFQSVDAALKACPAFVSNVAQNHMDCPYFIGYEVFNG